MNNKRGLSPVIAVVLLLLITIVAATIILGVVVPFVRDNLDSSKECFEAIGDVSFAETAFNCHDSDYSQTESRSGFSVRIDGENVGGFRVSLLSGGNSDSYDVENGTSIADMGNVRRGGAVVGAPLDIPEKGGVRTYVVAKSDGSVFEKAELFPILKNGRKCDLADEIVINKCEDSVIAQQLYTGT